MHIEDLSSKIMIGTRIATFERLNDSTIWFYGYGRFAGKQYKCFVGNPPLRLPIAKLMLDNGDTLWGDQCWWLKESVFRELASTRTIITQPYLREEINPKSPETIEVNPRHKPPYFWAKVVSISGTKDINSIERQTPYISSNPVKP